MKREKIRAFSKIPKDIFNIRKNEAVKGLFTEMITSFHNQFEKPIVSFSVKSTVFCITDKTIKTEQNEYFFNLYASERKFDKEILLIGIEAEIEY